MKHPVLFLTTKWFLKKNCPPSNSRSYPMFLALPTPKRKWFLKIDHTQLINPFLTSHSPLHCAVSFSSPPPLGMYFSQGNLVKVKARFSTELIRPKASHTPGFIHFRYSLSSGSHAPRGQKTKKLKFYEEKKNCHVCVWNHLGLDPPKRGLITSPAPRSVTSTVRRFK